MVSGGDGEGYESLSGDMLCRDGETEHAEGRRAQGSGVAGPAGMDR